MTTRTKRIRPENITAFDVLSLAQDLIRDPQKWIKGEMAQTRKGNTIPTRFRGACKFCSSGAVFRAVRILYKVKPHTIVSNAAIKIQEAAFDCIQDVLPERHRANLTLYNDRPRTTHAMIMRLFDKAKRLAQKCKVE